MSDLLKSAPERGGGPPAKPVVEGPQRSEDGRTLRFSPGPSTMLRMVPLPVPGRI